MRHCLLLAAAQKEQKKHTQYKDLSNLSLNNMKFKLNSNWNCTEGNNGYGKVLYFSKHYTHLRNILHGIESRICTSLQKQYVICIKQYVHVFSLWSFVQQLTQSKKKEYSWNECCLLSGSLHMASHILLTEIY